MRRAALLLLVLCGCAHLKNDTSVCPEFRSLRCVAGERCSFDSNRSCKVCECEKMDSEPPSMIQPDDIASPP